MFYMLIISTKTDWNTFEFISFATFFLLKSALHNIILNVITFVNSVWYFKSIFCTIYYVLQYFVYLIFCTFYFSVPLSPLVLVFTLSLVFPFYMLIFKLYLIKSFFYFQLNFKSFTYLHIVQGHQNTWIH